MKQCFSTLLALLVVSCNNKSANKSESSANVQHYGNSLTMDSVLTFSFVTNFSHQNISNKSDRQIDLLFNSINNYLGGQTNYNIHFKTECLQCEPIQEYMGGLLFAKRLLITNEQIKYYKTDFEIPDSLNRIELYSDHGERTNPKFNFTNGKGSINYVGVSCNDADYNKVRLTYSTGEIEIDSLINASFFEYDLNKDGYQEQFLIGTRNCTPELIILRINKSNNKK